jgi:hypothetical protein
MLYQYGEHAQLAGLRFDPLWFNTLESLRDAYAATTLLSKADFLETGFDLEQRALDKFEKFERSCRVTNSFFKHLEYDPLFVGHTVWLHNAIIRKISTVLGEFSYQDLLSMANWGPGSSTFIPRRYASSTNKFQYEIGMTRRLFALFPVEALVDSYPLWFNHFVSRGSHFSGERGNKVITVAKDATADRVIAQEPGFNIWFQKAIGINMRRRLLRFGIDLTKQSKNQELALLGSKTGKVATLDFSSASDSIAEWVVEELFPPRWAWLMNACRSHHGYLHGAWSRWNKFSSMGNGFTFEVESLIFYAIGICCAEYLQTPLGTESGLFVNVYGDDVVIPTVCVDLFSEMCLFYGFTINTRKTHYVSPFRESCGKHYYSGVEVTPIYLKGKLSTIPAVFKLANAVRRLAHRRNNYCSCDVRLRAVFDFLVSSIPNEFKLRIDEGLGDGGFISNWDEATPTRASKLYWNKAFQKRMLSLIEGWEVVHVTDEGKTFKSGAHGLLLSHLWDLERRRLITSFFRNRAVDESLSVNRWGELEQNLSFPWLAERLHPLLSAIRLAEMQDSGGEDKPETSNDVPEPGKSVMKMARSTVAQWHDMGPWL